MKEKLVPSTWLEKENRRLDCRPYLSGAIEAKILMKKLSAPKAPLKELTAGHAGGIYKGPKLIGDYVPDTTHGVPFLTNKSMLLVDLIHVDLLRSKDLTSPKLSYPCLEEGMTLISRSGAVGRMAYARSDMAGKWSSPDVLKVAPDSDAIKPGYLYAFLSGRFAVPLVAGGTYGSTIQHLEPQHIENLPVPVAPDRIQEMAHNLVTEAARLRVHASFELNAVIEQILSRVGLPVLGRNYAGSSPDISEVSSARLGSRMNGLFHSNYHRSALNPLRALRSKSKATVKDLATRVFAPPRFKRARTEGPDFGVALFSISALMNANPEMMYFIAKETLGIEDLIISSSSVLVPNSGGLVGNLGHAVLPYGDLLGGAVSNATRVEAHDEATAGYLFACLASEYGRRQLKARAFGSLILHLDASMVGEVIVPKLDDAQIKTLGTRAFAVSTARHQAVQKEREARVLVEKWIEKGGTA